MPRRQFNADLAAAAANSYDRISQVKKGESDGEVIVTYVHEDLEVAVPVRLVCQGMYIRLHFPPSGLETKQPHIKLGRLGYLTLLSCRCGQLSPHGWVHRLH